MRRWRWFVSGVVIGVLLSLAPACEPAADPCADCAGCCDAADTCQPGSAASACGANGAACQVCLSYQTCQAGACVGSAPVDAGPCGPSNCAGCCNASGQCVASGNQSCGVGGVACDVCDTGAGESCTAAGLCEGCGPNTCAGCCSGGLCKGGGAALECGRAGQACEQCPYPLSCVAADGGGGDCTAIPRFGDPCTSNADCVGLGAGAVCQEETVPGGSVYPGGYCTKPCAAAADCGPGTACLTSLAGRINGEESSLCLRPCTQPGHCRPGYACYNFGGADGGLSGCWLSPFPTPGLIGTACTLHSTCRRAGTIPTGVCILEFDAGAPTGYPRGYCSADCSADAGLCPDGSVCLDVDAGALCMALCPQPEVGQGACRPDYVCAQYETGGADGVCWPNCHNPGAGCPTGTCDSAGYCQ